MAAMIGILVRRILVVLLAGASAGCIGGTLSTVPFHEEPIQPSYALIYIYRLPGFVGGGNTWEVALDDIVVGQIRPNAYFTIHAAPGMHWLRVGQEQAFPIAVAMWGPLGAAVWVAGHRDTQTDEFKAKSGDVYYLRLAGSEHSFLPRDQAIGTLREMKYDRGD
jgi:hypothetical protein